jgi:hypothetical protein
MMMMRPPQCFSLLSWRPAAAVADDDAGLPGSVLVGSVHAMSCAVGLEHCARARTVVAVSSAVVWPVAR